MTPKIRFQASQGKPAHSVIFLNSAKMPATDDCYAALGFAPGAVTLTPHLLRQACYDALEISVHKPNAAHIRIAYAFALHKFNDQATRKMCAENAYKILTQNPSLLECGTDKMRDMAQPPPYTQRYLSALARVTNDAGMVTYMPGFLDHSLLKIIVHGKLCPELQADLEKTHAMLCRNATNSETSNRQLHYWGFKNLKKTVVYKAKIEIRPGHFVDVSYAEFTHVPKPGHECGLWSNARGYPSPKHYRLTRHDSVPKSTSTSTSGQTCGKRKRDISDELLQTLTATYDADLDKEEECMDLILHTLDLEFSAEMASGFEEWLCAESEQADTPLKLD